MSEAGKISCIVATVYGMLSERYVPDLFSLFMDPEILFRDTNLIFLSNTNALIDEMR